MHDCAWLCYGLGMVLALVVHGFVCVFWLSLDWSWHIFEQVFVFSQYGHLGAHHGIKGKEFRYLGGKPSKRMRDAVVAVEHGSVSSRQSL